MDNCWRENKNKYVMSYLSNLVQQNVFKQIQINFMSVGHTHNDVDQLFSVLSKYFSNNDAITIDDIHNVIECAMNGTIISEGVIHVPSFPNFSGWIEQENNVNAPHGHSRLGSFLISKFKNNIAGIKFKKRMHHTTWLTDDGEPYVY